MARRGRRFDVVVVDPPSFAARQSSVAAARRAYGRLTTQALALLEPGGLLVQASCSSRVTSDEFVDTVFTAARAVGPPPDAPSPAPAIRSTTRSGSPRAPTSRPSSPASTPDRGRGPQLFAHDASTWPATANSWRIWRPARWCQNAGRWPRRSSRPSPRSTTPAATSRRTTCPSGGTPTGRPTSPAASRPGARLGFQGPDQGYALTLAARLRPEVHVQAGESVDDAVAGCTAVALRRASLYGRAPVIHDLRIAFTIWGYFDADAARPSSSTCAARCSRASPTACTTTTSGGRSSTRCPRRRCG